MAELIAMSVYTSVAASGHTALMQIWANPTGGQSFIVANIELTSAACQSVAAGIIPLTQTITAASANAVTTLAVSAASSTRLGVSNAI